MLMGFSSPLTLITFRFLFGEHTNWLKSLEFACCSTLVLLASQRAVKCTPATQNFNRRKKAYAAYAILFGVGSVLATTARNVSIRKLRAANFSDFERAVDANLIMYGSYLIPFAVDSIDLTHQMFFFGKCAGTLTFIARILVCLAIANGNGAVA